MANVTAGTAAKGAAIVGFLIFLCGITSTTCGCVWIAYDGYLGHGLWAGIPLLLTGIFGLLSLTRNTCVFILVLCVLVAILAGIQGVSAGLELTHWINYIGDGKCAVQGGACTCIGAENIRIKTLDSCDKVSSINDIFITLVAISVIGALLCVGGAIFGCVGLATVRRMGQPGIVIALQPSVAMTTVQQPSYSQQPVGYTNPTAPPLYSDLYSDLV